MRADDVGTRLKGLADEPWKLALAGILLLALLLRLWGIKYGLPFAYQIDEERIYVRKAVQMLDAGSINPHYQQNPPLLTYLYEAIFAVRYGGARAHELIGLVPDREQLYLIARIVVALIGTVAVGLLYVAGRRFFDRRTGLVAAALIAVAFLPVFYSHVALNNVPAMTAMILSLIGTAGILSRGERRDYVLAGVGLGLAVATKYIFGIVLLPLIAAAALAPREPGRDWRRELAISLGVAFGCFAIFDPFALIHPDRWLHAVGTQGRLVEQHKYGQNSGDGFETYLRTFTWGLGWVPALAAIVGAGLLVREDRRRAAVLVPVIPLFVIYMGLQTRYFGRWLLPAFPIACLLAAHGALRLADIAAARLGRPRLAPALAGAAAAALLAQGLVHSVHNDRLLSRPHTLNVARTWMVENIPSDAGVVSEPFRAPSWRSPWHTRASPQFFLTNELPDLPYPRYLSAGLVDAYIDAEYCWVQVSSNYWGLALSDPVVADRAAEYYRALDRHGDLVFSASPWGDIRSPGRPGEDKVAFDYDWTYDFYPLSYDRPGPMVLVYQLHGGECSPQPKSHNARARKANRSGQLSEPARSQM